MRPNGALVLRPAKRTSASGRHGPGHRSPPKCARSPAASPRRDSVAACISRSSATIGRGCIGRSPPRRRWAGCRYRCTRTHLLRNSSTCSTTPRSPMRWSKTRSSVAFDHLTADEDILSYLPMAWVGDHLFSYAQWMVAGFTINCPESGDTVMTDLREIGPTYYFAPPRVFENLLTQVMIRMEDASALKRWLFAYFTGVARRCGSEILDGRPVSVVDRALYAIGNVLR